MTDKIIGTFFSRIIVTAIMLIIVIINTNTYGAEGTGTIALLILGLTILQLFSNFVGGGTLVYLLPRSSFSQILLLTYSWSVVSNIAGIIILKALDLTPEGFDLLLLILSIINSFFQINITLMQAKEEIKMFNLYHLFQVFLLISVFILLILTNRYFQQEIDITIYVYALLISYLIPLLFSFRFILKNIDKLYFAGIWRLFKEMFHLGIWVQLANFAQLMNYRLNYYLIEYFVGRKSLGVFEIGTKLSEAVWIFPKSIALVQYARLANCNDQEYAKKLTTVFLKIVFLFSLLAVLLLLLIPAKTLAFIFGPEFHEAKKVIYCLAPGIVFLSCLSIFSHHFSGFGLYWINSVSSIIGLFVTLVLGLIFIPKAMFISNIAAIQAAGLITSLSYLSSMLFSLVFFLKKTTATLKDFLITKADFRLLFNELSSLRQHFSKKKS
ncbi:oligosaccharide flippase family protein [Bacteroidales bacterium OttesenSCG-928-A14]|nr:oligosaccharide flippase family protein [Bacteroidales bacterium OttesenSCG-928-A14]